MRMEGRGLQYGILLLLAPVLAAGAGIAPAARAQEAGESASQFWHVPVWVQAGAWQDSTLLYPRREGGTFQGPLRNASGRIDSLRTQSRTVTVRFLRNLEAEGRGDFGGYRLYRVTNSPDTSALVLLRRYSLNDFVATPQGGTYPLWHFSQVDTSNLRAVWGASANTVFAGGDFGVLGSSGGAWSAMPPRLPTDLSLGGLWGSSTSDVYAVGSGGTILHFDGVAWSPVPSGTTRNLHAVWGSSAGNVYAVGAAGTVVHFDGSAWSAATIGTSQTLRGVWGSSASDVYAVAAGRDTSFIFHFDGSSWEPVPMYDADAWPAAAVPLKTQDLCGIWGSAANDVYAVGGRDSVVIAHFDGSRWIAQKRERTVSRPLAVWGSSASDVYAVGYGGSLLHYDGASWAARSSGTFRDLSGLWGSSASDIYAVGVKGTMLHFDGSAWGPVSGATKASLDIRCGRAPGWDYTLTFVDPDSTGSYQKVCRNVDHLGRCLSIGDSVWKLVAPPGPQDGFRTWYAVTYEARNAVDNNYEDLYVADSSDTALCRRLGACPNLNSKAQNLVAIPVVPTAGAAANLEGVHVVPNPFRGGEAWDPQGGNMVQFTNLPGDAKIKIYTVSGEFVRELHHKGNAPQPLLGGGSCANCESWDLKNGQGRDVASGIYIYRVEASNFSTQSRFVVIR